MEYSSQESPSWGTETLSVIRQIPECYETQSSLPCSKQFATDPIINNTNTMHYSLHIFKPHLILYSCQRPSLLKEPEKTVAGNVWSQETYLRILHKTIAIKCVLYLDMSVWVDYINFDVLLTVHLNVNLANDQPEAQFLYFIIRLLQSSTCFEQRLAHHQEVKLY